LQGKLNILVASVLRDTEQERAAVQGGYGRRSAASLRKLHGVVNTQCLTANIISKQRRQSAEAYVGNAGYPVGSTQALPQEEAIREYVGESEVFRNIVGI
jgi:hypothetical protein